MNTHQTISKDAQLLKPAEAQVINALNLMQAGKSANIDTISVAYDVGQMVFKEELFRSLKTLVDSVLNKSLVSVDLFHTQNSYSINAAIQVIAEMVEILRADDDYLMGEMIADKEFLPIAQLVDEDDSAFLFDYKNELFSFIMETSERSMFDIHVMKFHIDVINEFSLDEFYDLMVEDISQVINSLV